jgi:hypothetical protein
MDDIGTRTMTAGTSYGFPVSGDVADRLVPRVATFAFNQLQLGIVIYSLAHDVALARTGLLVLSFEIAILADCFLKVGNARTWALVLVVAAVALFAANSYSPSVFAFVVECLSIAFCAISLKKIRTITGAAGELKRRWRALGYVAAGLFSPLLFVGTILLLAIIILRSPRSHDRDPYLIESFRLDTTNMPAYLCIMFHHCHYFSYAYIVPLVAIRHFALPVWSIGLAFYIGWIGYYLLARFKHRQRLIVFFGHLLASAAVAGMLNQSNFLVFFTCWFATGVGGGGIVLLRDFVINGNAAVYERFKTWEAFGHLIGISCFLCGLWLESLDVAIFFAIFSGVACAVMALCVGHTAARA